MQAKSIEAVAAGARDAPATAGESVAAHPQYDQFINEESCRTISGLSKSERWRRIKVGKFPAPVRLGKLSGGRCTRWSLRAVLQWQQEILRGVQQ